MQHEAFMKRCLELAKNGSRNVSPNPMVGCVIVHKNQIIGEGFHQKYGEAHAEVNAIRSVGDTSLLKESTIYVSLEPCSHYGNTPPCADLIIQHQIPKVVIANEDPFPEVSGSGIQKLKEAGIEVTTRVLAEEGRSLNKRFFCFHEKKRPFILLKWAQTADGYMDIERNDAKKKDYWISSPLSKILVHQWRSEEGSIFVGSNTAKNDNPSLTVRLVQGKNPLRIVLDRRLSLDNKLSIFDDSAPTLILNEQKSELQGSNEFFKIDFNQNIFVQMMELLYQKNIQSIMVEGGKNILDQLIEQDLWDEARVFHSPIRFDKGLKAPKIEGELLFREKVGDDLLVQLRNKKQQ